MFASNILKMKGGTVEEVIYGCIIGLDGRIPDCMLAMHANCFDEIQKSMIHNLCNRHNGHSNRFDVLKSCCHDSLWDVCVHTDGAWWKLNNYCHQKDVGIYPDGCIICLKFFSVCCVSQVKKGDFMVCSICCDLFSSSIFGILINTLMGTFLY